MTGKIPSIDFWIDEAVTAGDRADEIRDAIILLSKYQMATSALITAYEAQVLAAEGQWRALEARPEYKFANRSDARIDSLRRHCKDVDNE